MDNGQYCDFAQHMPCQPYQLCQQIRPISPININSPLPMPTPIIHGDCAVVYFSCSVFRE